MSTTVPPTPWIAYSKINPRARLRLFCFPYAGGGASTYRTWLTSLPTEVDVCPVQLPGRENRLKEAPFTQLAPLIQTLAQALRPYMTSPFAFFGHSMGAIIAFELARYLRRQHEPEPLCLLVSGHRAPQIPDPDPTIYQLPEPEFVDGLRRLNGTPEAVLQNAELMRLVLPVLRADFTIAETYVYGAEEPLTYPISAFGGVEDSKTSRDSLEAWREQTRSTCTVRMFPRDHFFIHSAGALVLQAITLELRQFL